MASPKLKESVVEIEVTEENHADIGFRIRYVGSSLVNYVGFCNVDIEKQPLVTVYTQGQNDFNSWSTQGTKIYKNSYLQLPSNVPLFMVR
jgi:hypothetical protein